RAFPNAVDRRLPIDARHAVFLDVPITAEAFHGLADHDRRDLAHPVFRHWCHEAAPSRRPFILDTVETAGEPEDERNCRLHIECHVSQHMGHEWLINEQTAKDGPMAS